MNFAAFQIWREQLLASNPDAFDCGETNLYRALAFLRPQPGEYSPDRRIHRCDVARLWLRRYGFSESDSRRALVCRGIRHALTLIFDDLARTGATLWIPEDVYPIYEELASASGIEPKTFPTLPEPRLPWNPGNHLTEYLLVTNPWKPLGRFLSDGECLGLIEWLDASANRRLLMDCVYDLGVPFHPSTQKLLKTGRTILLHSITKGWLSPKTFGVALLGSADPGLEVAFRNSPPSPQQLAIAGEFLTIRAGLPDEVTSAVNSRKQDFLAALPPEVAASLLSDPAVQSAGAYFFPVRMSADELLTAHGIVGIPASVFGGGWPGSILTSLAIDTGAARRRRL